MTKKPRAVIYARFSTDKQDARSIEDQLRRCHKFAEGKYEVVATYRDEAVSGAKMLLRDGMQALLAEARRRDRKFDVVLVDDLSRFGRDIIKTLQAVFQDLDGYGVGVIDCSNGMASNSKGSRILFSALAMANDQFLQLVRTETHRGLEGRALAGFHTGGSCYGYRTEPEPNPADPLHPRAVIRVHQDEAKVVRRIFDLFASGASLVAICHALNSEGVLAPRSKGWSKNQLHSLLRNERYVGKLVWNKREWFVDARTERRRYRERPPEQWVTKDMPELAIISPETWAKVQARHSENATGPGKPGRNGYRDHILSGLLRCGSCGSSMSIVSRRVVDGVAWSQFGCSARHSRGPTACSNRHTISEQRLNASVLEALRNLFSSTDYEVWVQKSMEAAQRAHEAAVKKDDQRARLEADVEAQQRRVDRVAESLAAVGCSDVLVRKLKGEEAKLLDLRQALAAAVTPKHAPAVRLVSTEQVKKALSDLERLVRAKPATARETLAAIVERIVLTPAEDGYRARLTIKNNPAALTGGRVDVGSCGGRI